MILDTLDIPAPAFAERTGWKIKPEGACAGDVCVPLPPGAQPAEGRVAVEIVADRLGMPLLHDDDHDIWAVGPATVTGRVLASAEAPDLVLPDLEGDPFHLTSLRGRKVLLVAWASW